MVHVLIRILIPFGVVASGVGVFWLLGSGQQETLPPSDERVIPEVETVTLQAHQGNLEIEVDGIVTPAREIQVAAEVPGTITMKDLACRAGSFVEEGQWLIEIDARDYQLEEHRGLKQLEQSQAELDEADVEIANIDALIDLADRDLQLQQNELARQLRLTSSISQSEIDRAKRAVVTAENARQILENQLSSARVRRSRLQIAIELARSQLEKARLDLQRSRILAPVDGVIVRDLVEQGDYVQKGTALFTIEDTSAIEVRCNLLMEDLYWLWSQQPVWSESERSTQQAYQIPRIPATVTYQFARSDDLRFAWQGTLDRFDGIGLDERTRTVPCRVRVDQPRQVRRVGGESSSGLAAAGPPALVRGMYVTVALQVPQQDVFIKVPDAAIQPGKRVWRVRDDRLQQLGPLSLVRGISETDSQGQRRRFWLTPSTPSGLEPGDRLLITPLQGARDGMQVVVAPDRSLP
ncbi:MAG: HlyD family efflux transporter periplasmic adaptor subunit [Planctomycetaceae bacterium]|nr:MAG: HlyD family efflux transporter periplasmic adaptor subunit [Planctomycetaceae bacterium]